MFNKALICPPNKIIPAGFFETTIIPKYRKITSDGIFNFYSESWGFVILKDDIDIVGSLNPRRNYINVCAVSFNGGAPYIQLGGTRDGRMFSDSNPYIKGVLIHKGITYLDGWDDVESAKDLQGLFIANLNKPLKVFLKLLPTN